MSAGRESAFGAPGRTGGGDSSHFGEPERGAPGRTGGGDSSHFGEPELGADPVRHAIAQAARWRLAALLCERPRSGWHAEIARLASELADPELRALAAAAASAAEGPYLACFNPGRPSSPREVAHTAEHDPGVLLARLAAFYDAFAYRPPPDEPVDHVAVEAGFAAYLWLKEAYALASGDPVTARRTADGRGDFFVLHLGPLVHRLAPLLDGAPRYLCGTMSLLCTWLADAPAPKAYPLPMLDNGLECGAACSS